MIARRGGACAVTKPCLAPPRPQPSPRVRKRRLPVQRRPAPAGRAPAVRVRGRGAGSSDVRGSALCTLGTEQAALAGAVASPGRRPDYKGPGSLGGADLLPSQVAPWVGGPCPSLEHGQAQAVRRSWCGRRGPRPPGPPESWCWARRSSELRSAAGVAWGPGLGSLWKPGRGVD